MISASFIPRAAIATCLMIAAAPSFGSDETHAGSAEPVSAIWKVQRIEFNYRSTSIYYSCDGLRHKITSIVTALGARENVNVDLRCRPGGLVNDAPTLITLATPVEATPENVTHATTYSSETQLAARLNKVQLPTANDIQRFQAEWRLVQLNRNHRLNLEAGDCELLHGLITQVFPHLSVRVEKQRLNCSQGSASRVRPVLHVAALVHVPVVPMAYAPADALAP
jgi:hypothetical protein